MCSTSSGERARSFHALSRLTPLPEFPSVHQPESSPNAIFGVIMGALFYKDND